ncbi:hypothetical protein GCM10028808_49790 [Spirosoma migulaei]
MKVRVINNGVSANGNVIAYRNGLVANQGGGTHTYVIADVYLSAQIRNEKAGLLSPDSITVIHAVDENKGFPNHQLATIRNINNRNPITPHAFTVDYTIEVKIEPGQQGLTNVPDPSFYEPDGAI